MQYSAQYMLRLLATLFVLLSTASYAETTSTLFPIYKNNTLTIPRVDSESQDNKYQDVVFEFDATTGTWNLINYIITSGFQRAHIDKVEAIIHGEKKPIQVFLKVSGYFGNGCGGFDDIVANLEENKFNITLNTTPIPLDVACAAVIIPFDKVFPLAVYDLKAGTYQYSVNGEHNGSFTLTQDNHF